MAVIESEYVWPLTAALLLLIPAIYLFRTKGSQNAAPIIVTTDNDIAKPLYRSQVKEDAITVTKLYVHPIKSCRGTAVKEAHWTRTGFQFDRNWCIINADDHHVLTLRALGEMVHIHPQIKPDSASPYGGLLVVDMPNGTFSVPLIPTAEILHNWEHLQDVIMFNKYEMDGYICQSLNPSDPSPADLLTAYLNKPVFLIMKGPEDRMCVPSNAFPDLQATVPYPDAYPIHFATEESLTSLNAAVNKAAKLGKGDLPKEVRGLTQAWSGRKVEMERFRPNIVLKGAGVAYAEDLWREVMIGTDHEKQEGQEDSQTMTIVDLCARCLLPNVDSQTGERDNAVPYKVIMKYGNIDEAKKPIFGTYAVPEGNGVVRVGDKLRVRKWAEDDEL